MRRGLVARLGAAVAEVDGIRAAAQRRRAARLRQDVVLRVAARNPGGWVDRAVQRSRERPRP